MIANYARLFNRLLQRKTYYYLFNLLCLSVGIASFLAAFIYYNFESSYDSFHTDADRIYRIQNSGSRTPVPLIGALQDESDDIEAATRLIFTTSGTRAVLEDRSGNLSEADLYFADSTFFEVFTFDAIQGNVKNSLNALQNVVITEKIAKRYFGKVDVVGQEMEFANSFFQNRIFRVSAVLSNPPPNSQLRFDVIVNYAHHGLASNTDWNRNGVLSFVKVRSGGELKVLDRIRDLHSRHSKMTSDQIATLQLMPLTGLHFINTSSFDFLPRNKKENVLTLLGLGLLVMVIAWINFINLMSAKSSERVKEIMIRKALGASQPQLATQFLFETTTLAIFAFGFALLILFTTSPLLSEVAGIDFAYAAGLLNRFYFYLPLAAVFLGVLSGWYPYFVISRFQAISNLKKAGTTSGRLRAAVVVIQFGVTTFFVLGTIIVFEQMRFIGMKDIGFDKAGLLVLNVGGPGIGSKLEVLRTELLKSPSVKSVSASLTVPGDNVYHTNFRVYDETANDPEDFAILYVDAQFVDNMGMKIRSGRSFTGNLQSDTMCVVINQTAASYLSGTFPDQWKEPVGKTLDNVALIDGQWSSQRLWKIIGVVEDFNFSSLHHNIEPLAIAVDPSLYFKVLVRVDSDALPNTLEFMKGKWDALAIDRPFAYEFLSQRLDLAYNKDSGFKSLFLIFGCISIFISSIGLYSLVLFVLDTRQKDICIRKVLGASLWDIVRNISRMFYWPVAIGFLLMLPVAIISMDKWLQQFAYRIDVSLQLILLSAFLVFTTASSTILQKTIATGSINPIKYLRS